jgi:hypothetical protein
MFRLFFFHVSHPPDAWVAFRIDNLRVCVVLVVGVMPWWVVRRALLRSTLTR